MSADDLWRQPAPSAAPLAATVVTGVLVGGVFGAVANTINGWVSREYFTRVMHWGDIDDVRRAAVAQGILEGLLWGLFLSTVFAAVTGIITHARSTYRFCLRHLLGIVVAIGICWFVGGLLGVLLASFSPEFFETSFVSRSNRLDPSQLPSYAWVGGSIWGAQFGGLASLIVGLVALRAQWRRMEEVSHKQVAGGADQSSTTD